MGQSADILIQIQFTATDLYDKDKVDIEHVVMEEVFQLLQCTEGGLTEAEAVNRISIFGPNKLEEHSQNVILQFLSFMWNPLSWVMEGAALVAIALSNGGGEPPDWQDFVGIVLLLIVNSTIGFVEERNAGNAVKASPPVPTPSSVELPPLSDRTTTKLVTCRWFSPELVPSVWSPSVSSSSSKSSSCTPATDSLTDEVSTTSWCS
jgi:hypothetical protein